MDNFPTTWMKDICTELNSAGFELPEHNGGPKWEASKFENSIQLMKLITSQYNVYDHLNSKGLVNKGYCPITGQKIGKEHYWQMDGSSIVYISADGKQQAQDWDRKEHIRLFGKEPITEEQREIAVRKLQEERELKSPLLRGFYLVFLIVMIIYFIKKC